MKKFVICIIVVVLLFVYYVESNKYTIVSGSVISYRLNKRTGEVVCIRVNRTEKAVEKKP